MHFSEKELSWSSTHHHVEDEALVKAYANLLVLQEQDHKEFKAMAKDSNTEWTPLLVQLVDRVITHYENHYRVESELMMEDVRVLLLLSPEWPSPQLDDAFLWVGGWRPSITFHLLDFNPGSPPLGAGLGELLMGSSMCDFMNISPSQLVQVDELIGQTVHDEAELTHSLSDSGSESSHSSASSSGGQVFRLGEIFGKADDLRVRTLKSLMHILSPIQAVQFFIPAAELHLKVQGWTKNKEAVAAAHGTMGRRGDGPEPFCEFFERWIHEQEWDLEELTLATASIAAAESTHSKDELTRDLCRLVSQGMCHYKSYYRVKSKSVKQDVLYMLAATWMNPLEHAFLWIGGWRPTISIHLLYSIAGLQLESQLTELLQTHKRRSSNQELGDLTQSQLIRVDHLQMQTIKEERELSETLACLQETLADSTMVKLSHKETQLKRVRSNDSVSEQVKVMLVAKEEKLKEVCWKADNLRLRTFKNVVDILNPIQAANFLIGAAELHLRLHEWGHSVTW